MIGCARPAARRSEPARWTPSIGAGDQLIVDRRGRRHDQAWPAGQARRSTSRDPRAAGRADAEPGAHAGPGLEPARRRRSSRELDDYVAARLEVTVVADIAEAVATSRRHRATLRQPDGRAPARRHHRPRACSTRSTSQLTTTSSCCATPTSLDAQQADAQTLITLLHLRDIADAAGATFSIVSEMLDVRNRALAEVTQADDFIVSDKLISLMLAQVSENKQLNAVFADLFDPEGSEIYLKPAGDYVALGPAGELLHGARGGPPPRRGRHRLPPEGQANDAAAAYGVAVNPAKSAAVTFGPPTGSSSSPRTDPGRAGDRPPVGRGSGPPEAA